MRLNVSCMGNLHRNRLPTPPVSFDQTWSAAPSTVTRHQLHYLYTIFPKINIQPLCVKKLVYGFSVLGRLAAAQMQLRSLLSRSLLAVSRVSAISQMDKSGPFGSTKKRVLGIAPAGNDSAWPNRVQLAARRGTKNLPGPALRRSTSRSRMSLAGPRGGTFDSRHERTGMAAR